MADVGALTGQLSQLDASFNPIDVYNRATTELGIPDARARVKGLQTQILNSENALKAVDPSVTGRTSGHLVTEAQRQRLVGMETKPIADTYNEQNKHYGVEQGNLTELNSEVNTRTSNETNAYNVKRQSLLDQIKVAQEEAAAAEARRQFEANMAWQRQQAAMAAASRGGGGGGGGGSGGGGGGGAAKKGPSYQQRAGGGFNFQNASGKAISARLYAQLTGTNFNTLLRQMAASGDAGAKDVLAHGGSAKSYKALTWD